MQTGSYPFRFGGSVKAAIAEAGGKGHPTEQLLSVAMFDFITVKERVSQIKANRLVLPVRKARLEAQQDGREYFEVAQPFGSNS